MTLLEQAARAVYAATNWQVTGVEQRLPSYDEANQTEKWHAENVARKVLEAVREPNRRWAADVCDDLCEPELVFNPAPASAFTAIIDAILRGERVVEMERDDDHAGA